MADPVAAAASSALASRVQVRGLRWWVAGLVFLATVINYVDRQTVNVLAPVIIRDLGLSKVDFARIGAAFLLAYTVSQTLSGRLFDRIGTRAGFAVSITVWSLAAMGHAFAGGFRSLLALRFLLGLGEAGNWPGAAKAIAEWFPVKERAFGMAIFNSGAALGAMFAPPLIVWMQARYGWPQTFLITGALGFAWLALWLVVFRPRDAHPWLTPEERAYIVGGQPAPAAADEAPVSWGALLGERAVWAWVLGRFLVDPIWWLYLFWLPQYLHDARGFDLKTIGAFAWVPYLAADLGALSGGYLSGWLIRRGVSVDRARKACMAAAALLMPAGILAVRVESALTALALIAVVLYAFQFWINNLQTLPSDVFPATRVGAVFGLGGTAAGAGSMLFTLLTGWVVQHFGYAPIFTLAGLLAPLGLAAVLLLAGEIRPLSAKASA